MNFSDIAIAYVMFADVPGGKRRPIFILEDDSETLTFYNVTTKYKNKSSRIKKQYYKIQNWKEAGLNKQSWIDIGNPTIAYKKYLGKIIKIGSLTKTDLLALADFVNKYNTLN